MQDVKGLQQRTAADNHNFGTGNIAGILGSEERN